MKRIYFFLFFLTLFASTSAIGATISGTIYHDGNKNSRSHFDQEMDDQDVPLPDITVSMWDGTAETQVQTGDDGVFAFDNIDPGTYFLFPALGAEVESTTRNRPLRTPQAILEGTLNYVHIGDSIGVYGGTYHFPERLTWFLDDIVDVNLNNVAVGGSTSWQWLPGADKAYFEDRLLPHLDDADLVTITISGNDLTPYVEGMPPYDVGQIIQNFLAEPEWALEMFSRVTQLVDAIQAENPNVDVLYVIYPNFGNSTYIIDIVGAALQPLTSVVMEFAMDIFKRTLSSQEQSLVLADMTGMLGNLWLDDYLIDEVHPNDAGSQLYADCIFQSLGGVIIEDEEKLGEERMLGFYAPDLVPPDDDDDDDDDDDSADDDDDDDDDDDNDDAADDDDEIDDDDDDDDDNDDATDTGGTDDDDDDDGCCG